MGLASELVMLTASARRMASVLVPATTTRTPREAGSNESAWKAPRSPPSLAAPRHGESSPSRRSVSET
ncbi:MAG TPA: hypothetical protein VLQ93_07890 [Myxococcaceae bacterium]|nr:hypothetical protein [Myxococcaceae bacterium]